MLAILVEKETKYVCNVYNKGDLMSYAREVYGPCWKYMDHNMVLELKVIDLLAKSIRSLRGNYTVS